MEKNEREVNVTFGKNGKGQLSTRMTLPIPWVKEMGLTKDEKKVKISFDGKKIVIEKA